MSIVPRLFNSSRFVRAINLSGLKSSVNVNYSTFPSSFGYVSLARPTHQLPATKFGVCAQRFYSDKTGDSPTQKSPQYDEKGAEIIYTGKFKSRIVRVKLFSLSSSMMGLAAMPILQEKCMEIGGTGLAAFVCSIAGIFTFITPVLLHFVTKKYVIEVTHDPKTDEYVATTVSFFLMKNEVSANQATHSSFIKLDHLFIRLFLVSADKIQSRRHQNTRRWHHVHNVSSRTEENSIICGRIQLYGHTSLRSLHGLR